MVCAQLALHRWAALPPLRAGDNAHRSLLQLFHRLIEVHESGQIMVDVAGHARQRSYPNFKGIVQTWRDRLPNAWDAVAEWDDVLGWRAHVFSTISRAFAWGKRDEVVRLTQPPVRLSICSLNQSPLQRARAPAHARNIRAVRYLRDLICLTDSSLPLPPNFFFHTWHECTPHSPEVSLLHDAPWTAVRLAHVARKQRLHDVSLAALARGSA